MRMRPHLILTPIPVLVLLQQMHPHRYRKLAPELEKHLLSLKK
jgi:hypothetical protein